MQNLIKQSFIAFFVSVFLFSISFAENIYYVNTGEVLQKSALRGLMEQILAQEDKKLQKEYKIDINKFKSGKNVSQDEINRFIKYRQSINLVIQKLSLNSQKIVEEEMKKFAKAKGYNVIVAETMVVYCSKPYNKTKEFIQFLNKDINKNRAKILKELKK